MNNQLQTNGLTGFYRTARLLGILLFFFACLPLQAQFSEVDKIQASDKAAIDRFGVSVSISGDRAIVGTSGEDTGGSQAGAAYVFELISGTWTEVDKIQASDKAASDLFGVSVSISGDRAIVGANFEDTGGANAGAAYLFEPSSNQPPDCSGAAIADQSADANCQATISGADVTGVTDPDGDQLTITVSPTTLVLGANTVTVNADDGNGGMCSDDITVNVVGRYGYDFRKCLCQRQRPRWGNCETSGRRQSQQCDR